MSSPTIAPDPTMQRLADEMSHQFEAAIQRAAGGGSTRDAYPGQSGWGETRTAAPGQAMPTAPEVQERFLPVLAALLPAVVSAVPSIIDGIRQQNRDIMPTSRAPEQVERDFLSVLGAITPKLVESIPTLLSTLQSVSRELPRDEEEATTRFLGSLFSVVVPQLIKAGPGIAATLLGGRRGPTGVSDPEMTTRFIGPLLAMAVPALLPQVPKLIKMFGGR